MTTLFRISTEQISVQNPLLYTPKPFKSALIAEGGGQRGIFTAGVLDTFLNHNFTPFDVLTGTSAGAQNISSYHLNQHGFAQRAIRDLTTQEVFFNVKKLLKGEPCLNLDWYFDNVNSGPYQLPIHELEHYADRQLIITTSDKNSMEGFYHQPTKDNIFELLKASSAIPFLYDGVNFEGKKLIDGGLATPIPVQPAIELGCDLIVIIRTVPSHKSQTSLWQQKASDINDQIVPTTPGKWFSTAVNEQFNRVPPAIRDRFNFKKTHPIQDYYNRLPHYNEMYRLMQHHNKQYANTLKLIEKPPKGTVIIEISPARSLASRSLGSKLKSLDADYFEGVKTAEVFLNNFRGFFSSNRYDHD